MKTARRYDTKLPCPACGHMQSQTDKAKLWVWSFHRISWSDIESSEDWATDYMPYCNGCDCKLEVIDKYVKGEHGREHRWYWRALLDD